MEKVNIFAEHKTRFHPNVGDDALPCLNFNNYLSKIPLVTSKEMAGVIKHNISVEKSYDLVTDKILKGFQKNVGKTNLD